MARKKTKGTEFSVFKGREAKLNLAIFQILAQKGPQTIYEIHKQVIKYRDFRKTRYASVNKRLNLLTEAGYVKRIGSKKTKAGFPASIYELCYKTYLFIFLNLTNLEELILKADDKTAQNILASLIDFS